MMTVAQRAARMTQWESWGLRKVLVKGEFVDGSERSIKISQRIVSIIVSFALFSSLTTRQSEGTTLE
jgi:energy-coupling factor transporter transmembrane protein EcfT